MNGPRPSKVSPTAEQFLGVVAIGDQTTCTLELGQASPIHSPHGEVVCDPGCTTQYRLPSAAIASPAPADHTGAGVSFGSWDEIMSRRSATERAGIERVVKPVVDRAASEPSPEWLDLNELPRSGHLADTYDGRAPAGGIAKFSDGYPDLAAASCNLLKPKMISTTICRGYGL